VGRNWVTGRRLSRGATAGVRIAALSAKGFIGPLVFSSSSSAIFFFSICLRRLLNKNQANTKTQSTAASTPITIPAVTTFLVSFCCSVWGWVVAEAPPAVADVACSRAASVVGGCVEVAARVVEGARARVVSVTLSVSSGTNAVGSVVDVLTAFAFGPGAFDVVVGLAVVVARVVMAVVAFGVVFAWV